MIFTWASFRSVMPIEIPISKSVRSSGSTNWPPFIGPASFGWTGHVGFIHDVLKREYLAGYPRPGAATGRPGAGGASAPRDTRRCRFFTCTNATGRKPRRVREQDAGRKPAATGRQGAGGAKAGGAKAKAQVGNLRLRVGRKSSTQVGKPAATLLRPALPSFALPRFPAGCCPESACTC